MNKSQTRRAVQARRWRDSAREKRRMNNVIAEYVRYKHKNIYNDCYELYQALKKRYPNLGPKCDLTKTGMFKRLIRKDSDTSSDEESSTVDNSAAPSTSTETVPPAVDNSTAPSASTESVPPTVDNSTAPAISNELVPDPVQAPLIPVQHLHVNYNSVGEITENLIQEGEYVNMNALNNEILNDLINDLERDENIQGLLNDINVQPMEQEEDVDEGIGLNLQNEVEELLGFDFEYDF